MTDSLAEKTVRNAAWTYLSFIISKFSGFITTIFLTRLLVPAEMGIVGFAATTIAFLDAVRDMGVGLALIQRRKDIERASHTAFYLNIGVNFVVWLIAIAISPFVADFFREPLIVWILPIMSSTFVIGSFGATHDALLRREMQFSKQVIPQFYNSLLKSIVSIGLAVAGYGVWSLVWGLLVGQATYAFFLWRVVDFRPKWIFDWDIAKELLTYGYKVSLDAFLGSLQANIDYVFIGRFLGDASLGLYTVAFRIPELLIISFCTVVAQVLFPAYSSIQNKTEELREAIFAALRYISIFTFPVGIGLALTSGLFIDAFFGETWSSSPEISQIMATLSIYGIILSISWNVGDVYKAIDRADILWKTAVFEFVLLAPVLYILAQDSAYAVALGHVLVAFILSMARLIIAARILKFSLIESAVQFIPAGVAVTAMGFAVWYVIQLTADWASLLSLFVSIGTGVIVYPIVLFFFERDLFFTIIDRIRSRGWDDDDEDEDDDTSNNEGETTEA